MEKALNDSTKAFQDLKIEANQKDLDIKKLGDEKKTSVAKEKKDLKEKVDELTEKKRVLQEKFDKSENDRKKLQYDAKAASSKWMTKETDLQNIVNKTEKDSNFQLKLHKL